MPKFEVTYREEFSTIVEAKDKNEAITIAEHSNKWKFIYGEGHADLFTVEKI